MAITKKARNGYFRERNKKIDAMVDSTVANDRQVGGDHYKAENPDFQHWDLMAVNNVGYFPGQVTKYVDRWRKKGGKQDLEKASHYLQKLLELTCAEILPIPDPRQAFRLDEYRETHEMDVYEYRVFKCMLTYTSIDDLLSLQDTIETLKNT